MTDGESIKKQLLAIQPPAEAWVEELCNSSDRGFVIALVAELDHCLGEAIRGYLQEPPSEETLLGPEQPLSTFSAKIRFAQRVGLVDSYAFRALNYIRKIRNAFAHEPVQPSLDDGRVGDWVNELSKLIPLSQMGKIRFPARMWLSFGCTYIISFFKLPATRRLQVDRVLILDPNYVDPERGIAPDPEPERDDEKE